MPARSQGLLAQRRPPQEKRLCRARDPLWEDGGALALEPAHGWERRARAACKARGSGADPGCRGIACRRSAEAGPAVSGSRQPSRARKLRNTSTKRKGNQLALTCKQGLPSGEVRSHRPPGTLTCTPIRLQPIHLPAPKPSRRGDPSWWRLQLPPPSPSASGKRKPARQASAQRRGQGAQLAGWEWWTRRSPAPGLDPRPRSLGFMRTHPARSPGRSA